MPVSELTPSLCFRLWQGQFYSRCPLSSFWSSRLAWARSSPVKAESLHEAQTRVCHLLMSHEPKQTTGVGKDALLHGVAETHNRGHAPRQGELRLILRLAVFLTIVPIPPTFAIGSNLSQLSTSSSQLWGVGGGNEDLRILG